MEIKQNVTLLSVSKYSFVNEQGQQLDGTTVWYYDDVPVNEENRVGFVPIKASLPSSIYDTLKGLNFPLPVIANVKLDLARGKFKVQSFEQRGK